MAPLFVSLNKTAPWSPCSALYITEFFDNGHGREYFRLRVKDYTLSKSETEQPHRDFCQCGHLPQHCGSVIRADSEMNKTYCYSSHTLTMASLLKHVTPLKLWVVEIVYLALDFHILFSSPFLCLSLCLASLRCSLPPCCASCIVCILARPISEPSFPLSHTMDFFLFFTSSAKSNSWCQQNMFFISWKMPPTKTHVAENVHSEVRTSLTTPNKKLIECNKESLEGQ